MRDLKAFALEPWCGVREIWRRREGVEPSGDLTAPRLVLKTSGTAGHRPSPYDHIDTIAPCTRIQDPRATGA
jgi:hypothetical protein